jgi:tRNA A37 methylthiotransferase MiaB
VGKTVNTLVEELDGELIKGKTDHFAPIHIAGSASIASVIPVRITKVMDDYLIGQRL